MKGIENMPWPLVMLVSRGTDCPDDKQPSFVSPSDIARGTYHHALLPLGLWYHCPVPRSVVIRFTSIHSTH
jgi:hypothetical protein